MSTRALYHSSAFQDWNTRCSFELSVVHEDEITRERAAQLQQRLVEQFQREYDFITTWWELQAFADFSVLEAAARAAARADMVILSLETGRELPPNTLRWSEAWLARRTERKGALVALVQHRPESLQSILPVRSYLQTVARLGQMDFFFHSSGSIPDLPFSLHATREYHPMAAVLEPVSSARQNYIGA